MIGRDAQGHDPALAGPFGGEAHDPGEGEWFRNMMICCEEYADPLRVPGRNHEGSRRHGRPTVARLRFDDHQTAQSGSVKAFLDQS